MAADVEKLLRDYLVGQLGEGVRVCTDLTGIDFDADGVLPLVHIEEIPSGAVLNPAIDLCDVDIDVYAKGTADQTSRETARLLAEQVRQLVLDCTGTVADEGLTSVNRVSCPRKPTRLPYDNSDLCRYGGMFRLWIHSRA